MFWALYSPYFILNSGSATFSDLSQAAIEAKSILTLDIIDDVKEIKNTRNLIMNSSIKLTWIRFGGGVSSDTLSQEMEMYEQIIFSTPGDEFELRVSERINQIERKVKDIKTDQY